MHSIALKVPIKVGLFSKLFQKYVLSSYVIVECCPLWYT